MNRLYKDCLTNGIKIDLHLKIYDK